MSDTNYTIETRNIFTSVRAERFGNVWLCNDGQECYWTTGRAMQSVARFAKDEDSGYDRWCSATRALGYREESRIGDRTAKDAFTRECLRWTKRIEDAGGYDYRLLVQHKLR